MSTGDDLEAMRQRIDVIDQDLLRLINDRARCAQEVARIKAAAEQAGEEGTVQFYRPEREAAILRGIKERNPGPLGNEEAARLFREIMSACLALERPLNAAYLGPAGTFTQAAVIKHFGHSVRTTALPSIGDIFREVEAGSCDYGVVPVENSTEGVISHTLDLFMTSPLAIAGEVSLRIHHHLLSGESHLGAIRVLYSHQQSLAQCRGWLDRHLPHAERVAVDSNAEAARLAAGEPALPRWRVSRRRRSMGSRCSPSASRTSQATPHDSSSSARRTRRRAVRTRPACCSPAATSPAGCTGYSARWPTTASA